MPVDEDTGALRPFDSDEIEAMNIRTFGVRDQSHGEETRELGQNTLRRSFHVAWDERFNFCALCCGDEIVYDDSGTARMSRMLPDDIYGRHPDFPEMVATKIERIRGANGAGTDDEDGVVEYPDAEVTVFYEHVKYELKSDEALVSEGLTEQDRYTYFQESSGDVEVYDLPNGCMKYIVEGGTGVGVPEPHLRPIQTGVKWVRPVETFTYVWERIPYELFAPGGVLFNKVYGTGLSDVDLPWLGMINRIMLLGRLAGTVQLQKVSPTLLRAHNAQGWRWRIAFTFAYSVYGWANLRFFPAAGGVGSGVYFVSNDDTYHTPAGLPDNVSIVNGARDLNDLWHVNI